MEDNLFVLFNEKEWQLEREYKVLGYSWSNEDLEKAKLNKGFIGTKFGVDCFLSLPVKVVSSKP